MPSVEGLEFIDRLSRSEEELHKRDLIAVTIVVTTVIGYALSVLWDRYVVPQFFWREERALTAALVQLTVEADSYTQVDKLHLQSQVRRRIIAVRRRLSQLQVRRLALTFSLKHMFTLRAPWGDPRSAPPAPPPPPPPPVNATGTEKASPLNSPNSVARAHGTRSAVVPASEAAAPQTYVSYWCEVAYNTFPRFVHHGLRLGPLVGALLTVGNMPALVALPRDVMARVVGQFSLLFLVTHLVNFFVMGPRSLQNTGYLLQETDQLAYETTRHYKARHPQATDDDVLKLLTVHAANPYASVFCWYLLCVIAIRFAARVMR